MKNKNGSIQSSPTSASHVGDEPSVAASQAGGTSLIIASHTSNSSSTSASHVGDESSATTSHAGGISLVTASHTSNESSSTSASHVGNELSPLQVTLGA